eukprot:10016697-Heterocapsa_arctica.AAC.1
MTRVFCASNVGIENQCWSVRLKLNMGLSNSDVVQNYQGSARHSSVIARMPEDRSNTFNNI